MIKQPLSRNQATRLSVFDHTSAPEQSSVFRQLSRTPSAFTLVEVLIALTLSLALMAVVYTAIDLHYHYLTAGRGEIARSQLFRSVLRKASEDFSSIVMQPPEMGVSAAGSSKAAEEGSSSSSGSSSSGSSSGGSFGQENNSSSSTGSSSTSSRSSSVSSSDDQSPLTFGLIGTDQFLHITVSRPARDLAYHAIDFENPTSVRSSDLVTLTYGTAPVSTERWKIDTEPTSKRPMIGFARRTSDLYSQLEVVDVLSEDDVIAPEIVEVQIRYFDGSAWFSSWDSRETGVLPRAVEISFGFWNEPVKNRFGRKVLSRPGTVTLVPHVFQIPISTPSI